MMAAAGGRRALAGHPGSHAANGESLDMRGPPAAGRLPGAGTDELLWLLSFCLYCFPLPSCFPAADLVIVAIVQQCRPCQHLLKGNEWLCERPETSASAARYTVTSPPKGCRRTGTPAPAPAPPPPPAGSCHCPAAHRHPPWPAHTPCSAAAAPPRLPGRSAGAAGGRGGRGSRGGARSPAQRAAPRGRSASRAGRRA